MKYFATKSHHQWKESAFTPPPKGDAELASAIKQLSRLKYGRDRALVEAEIMERTQLDGSGRL